MLSLKVKLPIWIFIVVAAIGIAVIISLLQYRNSIFDEINLQSLENVYWSKNISQKDTLADWETYKNDLYEFEIKYPNTYKVYNDYSDKRQVFIGTNGAHRSPIEGIMIRATEENLSDLKNEIKNRDELTEILEEKQITINGINVYKLVVSAAIGYNDAHYLFTDGKNNFEIIWDSENQIQDQILSTFKFIEPIDTSNWQTYRNEKLGIEFKYLKEWGPVTAEVYRDAISGVGQEFYATFNNENFAVSANTSDFQPWESPVGTYLGEDPIRYCKEFEQQEDLIISADGCQKIKENVVAISYGFSARDIGPAVNLGRDAFIPNPNNKYAAITISYSFPSHEDDEMYTMDDMQLRNVIKNQLSHAEKDYKKDIDTLNQLLSTFKFIK